jgi:two-component system, NtrC family, sensor histidine kinase PilS
VSSVPTRPRGEPKSEPRDQAAGSQVSAARSQTLPPRSSFARRIENLRREDAELARKLASVAFVRVIAVSLSLGVLFVFAADPARVTTWQYTLIAATYALSGAYAIMLRYRAYILALAYVQIVFDTLIVTFLVIMTGGIESPFTFVYVFTVLGASVMLYRRGALIATLAYFLMFGTLVLLQVDVGIDLLPHVEFGRAMFSFVMCTSGIVLVGVLSSTLAEKLRVAGRELAERQIDYEELEELHAQILRSLPAGLMTIDAEGSVRYANEAALAILKRPEEEVVGGLLAEIAPSMAAHWRPTITVIDHDGPRERYEVTHRRIDGRTIRLGFSFAPLGSRSGSWGSIAVFQDVTDIVRLKDAYERAERLATVGKMAAGLAHEVRNPLASVCASIDVLKQTLNPPEQTKRLMSNVVKEADRLNGLITDFLEFARPREPSLKETDVSALVASVVDVLKNDQILASAELELLLERGVTALVDPDQVRQVVWNLARNGAEALAESPRKVLTLATRSSGEMVELMFRDTGPGISPEKMKRIFDPFFTTKERGTGLGLAITHSIVTAHGGRILVESKPEGGTEVTVLLPKSGATLTDVDILTSTMDVPRVNGVNDGASSRRR